LHFKDGAKFALDANRFDPSEPAQLHVERLDLDLEPEEVARSLSDAAGLCVLMGSWSGSGAIIAWDPVLAAHAEEDPFLIVDQIQTVQGKQPGAVGGGWIGHIGYQAGRLIEQLPPQPEAIIPLPLHSLSYYDHLLRFDQLTQTWYFEALLTSARSEEIFQSRDKALAKLRSSSRVARSSFVVV
jgi:anthranilate/para-aminobenzoate synthase component I